MFSAVEAQWILNTLDDASMKLTLSSYLTPDILKDRIMDAIEHETVVAVKEHFEVEKQYSAILKTHQTKIDENGGDDVQMDFEQLAAFNEMDLCLSDSTRTIVRLLKNTPAFARKLRDVCPNRDSSSLEFIRIFARLRKLVHDKLRMTAEEERAMKEQLEKLKEEGEEDTRRFQIFTETLSQARSDHKKTLQDKDQKIARLRKQIDELSIKTRKEREAFEAKMQQEAELAEQIFLASEQDLTTQLTDKKAKLLSDGERNYEEEMKEHRKKFFRAHEVEKLVEKYDYDMTEKHDSLTQLQEMYKEESEELEVLGEYFTGVDEELERQRLEIENLTKRRDEELKRLRTKNQATVLFRKLFRGYHAKCLAGGKKKKASKKDGKKK